MYIARRRFVRCRYDVVRRDRRGRVVDKRVVENGVVEVGADALLDTVFHGAAQSATWYMGLIDDDNPSSPTLSSADTMASHAGWGENTGYDETTRPEWTEGAASSQSMTNAAPVVFTFATNYNIFGLFIVDDNTKGGTAGTLWGTGAFAEGVLNVAPSDTVEATYTITVSES